MSAIQGAAQNLESIRIIAILSAATLVAFSRTLIRLMLMTLMAAAIVLLGVGAFVLLGAMHT